MIFVINTTTELVPYFQQMFWWNGAIQIHQPLISHELMIFLWPDLKRINQLNLKLLFIQSDLDWNSHFNNIIPKLYFWLSKTRFQILVKLSAFRLSVLIISQLWPNALTDCQIFCMNVPYFETKPLKSP